MGESLYRNGKKRHGEQPLALLWHEGKSVIRPDENGTLRYVYNSEELEFDHRSTVDPRTEHVMYSDYLAAKAEAERERDVSLEVVAELGKTALIAS